MSLYHDFPPDFVILKRTQYEALLKAAGKKMIEKPKISREEKPDDKYKRIKSTEGIKEPFERVRHGIGKRNTWTDSRMTVNGLSIIPSDQMVLDIFYEFMESETLTCAQIANIIMDKYIYKGCPSNILMSCKRLHSLELIELIEEYPKSYAITNDGVLRIERGTLPLPKKKTNDFQVKLNSIETIITDQDRIEYVKIQGYKNLDEAINKCGSWQLENSIKEWVYNGKSK